MDHTLESFFGLLRYLLTLDSMNELEVGSNSGDDSSAEGSFFHEVVPCSLKGAHIEIVFHLKHNHLQILQ